MKKKNMFYPFRNLISNLIWLYRPFIQYGKIYTILSLTFWCLIIPIAQVIGVYLPSAIVTMLDAGVSFKHITFYVILMQCLLLLQPMYEDTFNMFCKAKTLAVIDSTLKRQVFEKALKTDMKYIDDPKYYDSFSWAISHYANKSADAQDMVNRTVSTIITITSMLTIIAILSPVAIVVTVIGTIVENLMFFITNRYEVAQDEDIVCCDRKSGYCHRVFYESRYAMDLKISQVRNHLFRVFDSSQKEKVEILNKYAWKKIPWSVAGNLTFYIARTFVILNIAYGIYSGRIETVGAYITMMVSVETLKNALNEMFYYIKDANKLNLYAKRIRSFFEVESIIERDTSKTTVVSSGPLCVKLCNVDFKYEKTSFQIKNMSFTILPGEKIAIVGKNGVGKSTIVKLLLRLYDVDNGSIYINGINIKDYDLNSLRNAIGVAFQHTNIYALSLYDNINIYDQTKENIIHTVETIGVKSILENNQANIYSELTKEFDENGIILSGGEIQKIGIARLLAGKFGLVIFDEPSSALDPIAEHEMSELILGNSNPTTTIIIAHRLSTIRKADRIVLIEDGAVKESGTHEELMKQKGKYYQMFNMQAENYVN